MVSIQHIDVSIVLRNNIGNLGLVERGEICKFIYETASIMNEYQFIYQLTCAGILG